MNRRLRIITRVAIFAALVFIFSYFSLFLHNINPAFFIVFSAGFLWGAWPGIGVGVVGYFLWSNFNPYGPVPFPLLLSQLIGFSFTALIGVLAARLITPSGWSTRIVFVLIISGFMAGLLYHLFVDVVDAWLYQPFWPRLIGGLIFSLIQLISNSIIFPLFYPALAFMYHREKNAAL